MIGFFLEMNPVTLAYLTDNLMMAVV